MERVVGSQQAAGRRAVLAAIALVLGSSVPPTAAHAALLSEDGDRGLDTITRDTETGLRWLDLTESEGVSYSQMLVEIEPGGDFEGYRLATLAEIEEFYENAGLDLSASQFVPQNYAPALALAQLIGVSGTNGNCGTGCTFSFTQGFYDATPPSAGTALSIGIAWFDNSGGQSASDPQAPIGRISAGTAGDNASSSRGSWLVVAAPEPEAGALAAAACFALLAASGLRRRRAGGGARGERRRGAGARPARAHASAPD